MRAGLDVTTAGYLFINSIKLNSKKGYQVHFLVTIFTGYALYIYYFES